MKQLNKEQLIIINKKKLRKQFKATFKIKEVEEEKGIGKFSAIASPFGNVDSYGDIVEPKAFDQWLSENKDGKVPLLWQHDIWNPIGNAYVKKEKDGLHMIGEINLKVQQGKEAYELLKQDVLGGVSIGYLLNSGTDNEDGTISLTEINLKEMSVVSFPANEEATITSVKSALDKINESIKNIKGVKEMTPEELALFEELKTMVEELAIKVKKLEDEVFEEEKPVETEDEITDEEVEKMVNSEYDKKNEELEKEPEPKKD